ncbi:hypothetical protein BGZ49_000380 [Haplosporangium sp. Z 27]|nr:hypothetical protein BGZ49_000380 [Haplosporangium sp. Z 27]
MTNQNLAATKKIASIILSKSTLLTADPQDGCKDIKDTIKQAIALGVVGCNIEDANCKAHKLRTIDDSVHRIKLALETAKEAGVPEFAINARVDALCFGGTIDNTIERGKAYLAAGANTVFVWRDPGGRGISRDELRSLLAHLMDA